MTSPGLGSEPGDFQLVIFFLQPVLKNSRKCLAAGDRLRFFKYIRFTLMMGDASMSARQISGEWIR